MNTSMYKIAVLITVFNRKKKTLACLENLFKQIVPNSVELEIFLVDDGSTDGTTEAVNQKFPSVNVIRGTGDLYWNRGMYLAWKTAAKRENYDYYFWVNDDTFLVNDALKILLQTAEAYQHKAIVVGTTSAKNNSTHLTYGGRNKKEALLIPKDTATPCAYFNGNIVLVPKFAYKLLGFNDPIFHHALGDFDYGKRAYKKGIQMVVAPKVLGTCDAHETFPDWCNPETPFKLRWVAFRTPLGQNPEEMFIYNHRHFGLGKACLNYVTNHIRLLFPQFWTI